MAIALTAWLASCGGGAGTSTPPAAYRAPLAVPRRDLEDPRTPGMLTLYWDPPLLDTSDMAEIAGYRVYDGRTTGDYRMVTDVGLRTFHHFRHMALGRYYLAVTAYDRRGNESDFSQELEVEIEAPVMETPSIDFGPGGSPGS